MAFNGGAPPQAGPAPEGLILRQPETTDFSALVELQMAYELEEVVPGGANYNPESARLSLRRILDHEVILVAEYRSRLVGKINTNAEAFTRRQLGGVYVQPEYRRRGIATAMLRKMMTSLGALSLYVRVQNQNAYNIYNRSGFRTVADYRISYMK
jgi:predicted GNAT family acetyltransferase